MTNIEEISKEMRTQDNRATQYPLFVVVEDKKIHVGWDSEWDIQERIEDPSPSQLCDDCKKLDEDMKELPPSCGGCMPSGFICYRIEQSYALNSGVFFTQKACQEHIDANHYHYTNPRCYAIGCWRNGEMPLIMQSILSLTGPVPPHYK